MWIAGFVLMIGVTLVASALGAHPWFPGEDILGYLLLLFVPPLVIDAAVDEMERRRMRKP